MLNQLPAGTKIYVACGYTDMRKQIDGLASQVEISHKKGIIDFVDDVAESIILFSR